MQLFFKEGFDEKAILAALLKLWSLGERHKDKYCRKTVLKLMLRLR